MTAARRAALTTAGILVPIIIIVITVVTSGSSRDELDPVRNTSNNASLHWEPVPDAPVPDAPDPHAPDPDAPALDRDEPDRDEPGASLDDEEYSGSDEEYSGSDEDEPAASPTSAPTSTPSEPPGTAPFRPPVVSRADSYDYWSEAGPGYSSSSLARNYTAARQYHADGGSTLREEDVEPGGYIPGRVTTPDDGALIRYHPGSLPLIVICIHPVRRLSPYMRKNWVATGRTCWGRSCNVVTETRKIAAGGRITYGDNGVRELCANTVSRIVERTGGLRPYVIDTRIPKGIVDMNRSPREYALRVKGPIYRNHPDVIASWDDMHNFIREARASITHRFGGGLILDLHGQIGKAANSQIGGGFRKADMNKMNLSPRDEQSLWKRRTQYRFLLNKRPGVTMSDALRGPFAIGTRMAMRGVATLPSATMGAVRGNCFCGGGAMSRKQSRLELSDKKIANRPYVAPQDNFDALQVESYTLFMIRSKSRARYGEVFADAILDSLVGLYGFDIRLLPPPRGALSGEDLTRMATPGAECGPGSSSIGAKRDALPFNSFRTVEECVDFCKATPGCKHVEQRVPSGAVKGDYNKGARNTCEAFRTCNVRETQDSNVITMLR